MSQAGQLSSTAGPVPPSVATSYTTDINDTTITTVPVAGGTAVPVANILRVSGDNGITTVATPNADIPNNVTIRFIRGDTQTVGAQTKNVISQPTLTNSVLTIQIIVAGFSTDNLGIGAYGTAVVKNIAGTASLLNTVDLIVNKDAGAGELGAANITVTVSGANLLVNVVGVAGKTIDWGACLPGIVVSS